MVCMFLRLNKSLTPSSQCQSCRILLCNWLYWTWRMSGTHSHRWEVKTLAVFLPDSKDTVKNKAAVCVSLLLLYQLPCLATFGRILPSGWNCLPDGVLPDFISGPFSVLSGLGHFLLKLHAWSELLGLTSSTVICCSSEVSSSDTYCLKGGKNKLFHFFHCIR